MFIAIPTNPMDGKGVEFPSLDKAIQYCSVIYRATKIRAVVLSKDGDVLHRNYPQFEQVAIW